MVVHARLLLVAVLALTGMAVFTNSALVAHAQLQPSCNTVHAASGNATLEACHKGWFKGFPNLMNKGCTAVGVTAKLQYWSCPPRTF
jgi:hypothetical protein